MYMVKITNMEKEHPLKKFLNVLVSNLMIK